MPNQTDYNEQLLLQNLRNGSVEAFEQIFKLYWRPLYILAKSKVHEHEEAEEIIQNIFSTLWEKRESLLITNLSFYLQKSVKNRVLNIIRDRITQQKYWDYYKTFIPLTVPVTENSVAFNDLNEAVEEAVNLLPEKSRQVFKLSRIEGRTNAEIANLLHLSEKAIEYHLTKSLRKLRLHLRDHILLVPFLGLIL
jgi:RNA polymerase sigma-70 factor (ECF subfamily)